MVNISGDGLLEFAGTGEISTIASGAQINLYGADALIAAAGVGTTSDTALTGLIEHCRAFAVAGRGVADDAGSLSNSGNRVRGHRLWRQRRQRLSIGGTLTNSNFVQIGNGESGARR